MEVAASAPENIFKDTAQTLIAPPPLDAYSRRVLVLARLQQYQRLQAEDTHGGDAHNGMYTWSNNTWPAAIGPQTLLHIADPPNSTNAVADPAGDSNLRFRIAQVTLLQDVEKLTRIASDLEAKLLGRRRRVWFTHASLYYPPISRTGTPSEKVLINQRTELSSVTPSCPNLSLRFGGPSCVPGSCKPS